MYAQLSVSTRPLAGCCDGRVVKGDGRECFVTIAIGCCDGRQANWLRRWT